MSFPKGGEMYLMNTADMKYQRMTATGPSQPTSSASFFEKRMMSRMGFEMFE